MEDNWKLDHVGHAVFDIDSSLEFYEGVLGFKLGTREIVETQAVEVLFLRLENTQIELLTPLDSAPPESPLKRFLAKKGAGLHHVCYEVNDIRNELRRLKTAGVKLIDDSPRPGADDREVAFLHPESCDGVLIELCAGKGAQA